MAIIRAGFASGDHMMTIDPTSKATRFGLYNSKGEFVQFSAKNGFVAADNADASSPWAAAVTGSDVGLVRIKSFYIGLTATAAASATIQLLRIKAFSSVNAAIHREAIPVDTNSQVMDDAEFWNTTANAGTGSYVMAQFQIAITALVPNTWAAQNRGQTTNTFDFIQAILPALGPAYADGIPLRGSEEGLMLAQSSAGQSGQSTISGVAGSIEPYFPNNAVVTQPSTYNY